MLKQIERSPGPPPARQVGAAACRGLTLIELLVTMSVAAILLAVAIPSFNDVIVRNRVRGVSSELFAALNLARSEASRRGQPVSVCKSTNGTSCAGSGTQWDSGWIVFINEDDDSPAAVDTGETVLAVRQNLPAGTTVRPTSNFTNFVTYARTGLANNVGTFVVCADDKLNRARAIVVIRTRVVMATDGNGDGIPEVDDTDSDDVLDNLTSCTPP